MLVLKLLHPVSGYCISDGYGQLHALHVLISISPENMSRN